MADLSATWEILLDGRSIRDAIHHSLRCGPPKGGRGIIPFAAYKLYKLRDFIPDLVKLLMVFFIRYSNEAPRAEAAHFSSQGRDSFPHSWIRLYHRDGHHRLQDVDSVLMPLISDHHGGIMDTGQRNVLPRLHMQPIPFFDHRLDERAVAREPLFLKPLLPIPGDCKPMREHRPRDHRANRPQKFPHSNVLPEESDWGTI